MRIPVKSRGLDSIIDWAKDLVSIAILDGRLIESVEVTASDAELEHGLGRVMRGAVVVSSTVAQGYRVTSFTSLGFTISAPSPATVTLWVF